MSTPYESILRHEPALPGAKMCPACSQSVINFACGVTDCGCVCTMLDALVEEKNAETFDIKWDPEKMHFEREVETGPGFLYVPPQEVWDPEPETFTAELAETKPKGGRVLLALILGYLQGAGFGVIAVHPDVTSEVRIMLVIMGVLTGLFILVALVGKTDE